MPGVILPNRHTPSEIGERQVFWLLTIQYGGRTLRVASAHLDIHEAATGETHQYLSQLPELAFSEQIQFGAAIAEGVSIPLEIVLPAPVSLLEAQGFRLEGAPAELSRWVEGTDLSERRVIVLGTIADPEWGADGEPTAFSIESVIWDDDVLIPPENQRVVGRNWDTVLTLDPAELGLYYPIIFGMPGKVSPQLISRGWITGSCGVWVERDATSVTTGGGSPTLLGYENLKLVLAGHPVKATRVWLSTDAYPEGERFAVHQMQDNRGQIVSYVDATVNEDPAPSTPGDWVTTDPDGNPTYGLGSEDVDASFRPYATTAGTIPLFAGWLNDSQDVDGGEGGMVGPDGGVVRGAGDVLEVLLGYTGKPVDRGRFAAARPALARFKIDTTIEAQVKPWDWIRQHLLPLLPISIVTGPSGLYPVVWRLDATPADAVAHLDAGTDPRILRAGRVRVDSSEIRNSFTLDYAWSMRTNNFYGHARLGAGPHDPDDEEALVSLHCRLSQQRYRYTNGSPRIIEEKLQTRIIYDTATANAILSWRARAFAFAQKRVAYVVPERDYAWLERGSVILLTDPEIDMEAWLCLVENVEIYDDGTLGLVLVHVEDPARDSHVLD